MDAFAELVGEAFSGGEIRQPKSWGNGYLRFSLLDFIKIVILVVSVTAVYFGVTSKIDAELAGLHRGLEEQTKAIREVARADSIALSSALGLRDLQRKYLWDENQQEHVLLWSAVRRGKPPERPRYLQPWRLAPDAWTRGEAPATP